MNLAVLPIQGISDNVSGVVLFNLRILPKIQSKEKLVAHATMLIFSQKKE